MNLDIQPLCELIYIQSGFAFKSQLFNQDNGLPLIRIRNVTSGNIDTFYTGDYKREYIVENGDLLVSMDGEFRLAKWNKGKALLNQRVCKLTVTDEKLLEDYLFYYLPKKLKNIEDKTPFVTVKHLSVKDINKISIPLPPLSIQKKIVRVLDKARELIDLREEQIRLLDELVQSIFYDMFGDPVENPMGWDFSFIHEVILSITSGWSLGGDERPMLNGEFGVLKISAVTSGKFLPQEYKVVSEDVLNSTKQPLLKPCQGDLLFSRANTRELVAASCIVDKDYENLFLPDKLWKLNVDKTKLNNYWFRELLANTKYRRTITKKATGTSGSMLNISKKKLLDSEIPLPPIALQNEFTVKVQKIEAQKALMQQSLEEMKNNYNSLMQRAFKGELFG